MFLEQVQTAGALPALEATLRFAGARQRVIAHNIANLETPDFRPADVSPVEFQRVLAEAVDDRRQRGGGASGKLELGRSTQIEVGPGGSLKLTPRTASGNVLFHDRNNRDLERTMQSMVENASAFRAAADLMRNRRTLLINAMSERVA